MKKYLAVLLTVVLCLISFAMPSNAINYGNFSYEVVNNEAVITKYIGTERTSITVPATIQGITVVAIGEGAFKDNTELTTVTVSSGIKDIGASAFENCTALATINLPETIIHIGEKAIYNTAYYNTDSNWKKPPSENSSSGGLEFGNGMGQIQWEDIAAKDLEYLYLGKNLIEISFSGTYSIKNETLVIADGAFAGCNAERVILSPNLVTIGKNAFKDCKQLKEITFYESVESVGDSAFEGCISLEKVNLPDKYIEMNSSAFYNTGIYNNPEKWDNNALYINNILIDTRDINNIIEIKAGTKYIIDNSLGKNDAYIPETVTAISENIFADNTTATIFGHADTFAQEYATAKNINFVDMEKLIKGDLNTDTKVDVEDYKILCEIATTNRMPNLVEKLTGDMDDDGAIDGIDVIIFDLILNNMPPSRLKGDVNGDNKVDTEDYNLLIKIVSTSKKITDNVMFQRADINEDGAVDSFDAVYLDLALNGLVALI